MGRESKWASGRLKKIRGMVSAGAGALLLLFPAGGFAGIFDAGSWGYQLQDAVPSELAASAYDVLVIDYSKDGSDSGAYSRRAVESIRRKGKIVLAYFSIGEAEDYRFYWNDRWRPGSPPWLGPENPDWKGNYKVRYWESGWWNVALRPYLDRILDAGFDGAYLDIVDAYWYWRKEPGFTVGIAASKMIRLVEKIGNYARQTFPDFILCPQNAESILDDVPTAKLRKRYLDAIQAIGVEDLFYHYGSSADREYRKAMLKQFAAAGKRIFNVEYVSGDRWKAYLNRACSAPFPVVPYGARPDRELDELVTFPKKPCGP
ncbi:MAG TPA: endo alpha-1,4 polygalactosaminidase [Syntrophobacteraceae bacterium]|nr:endo alpha-1,4 polygalactosaminidase [Syntrophobacteraceae bacterium]